ncbi:MAG: CpaF family protein, partial [Thermoleophilia bacterium]|nr:CpaF family protein [Thermoleophilia bacterium]
MAHRNAPIVDAIRERIWSECDAAAILAAGDQAPALVRELATSFLREERYVVGSGRTDTIVESVVAATLGLGPLEPLLADPEVAEIMVNGPHNVFIERRGRIERVDVQFHDDEHVRQVIDRILAPISRRLDALSPMVDARLPDGSRVNAIIPPLAVEGPALTIRRFLDVARTVDDLQRLGAFPPDGARTLRSLVSDRANVLVAGATSSGKTTLLAAALAECDERDRIIVIEDSAELSIDRPHRIRLEARAASFETHGEVRVRDLVKNALRMRPDRLVVGEVRGSEAFDLVQAMSTGHRGSWATVHANGPDDAMLRVEAMALAAG